MTDPARGIFDRAGELLFEIRPARVALEAADDLPGDQQPEREVYLTMLESFERSLLATLEDVVPSSRCSAGTRTWNRGRGGG